MSEMCWDIPNQIWNIVRFGTLDTTIFQVNINTFGLWLGFRHMIQNLTMSQINMVRFSTFDVQTDHIYVNLRHSQIWNIQYET